MNINHFDEKWVFLRKQLSKKGFTLSQLRAIEDQALLAITEEDSSEGNAILAYIDEKREELLQKENLNGCPKMEKGLHFCMQEPLALEFDPKAIGSTFSSRMGCIAKMIRKQNSADSYKNHLNETQKREIAELAGNTMSPEVLAHAMDEYVGSLRKQIKIAEAFYFGRIKEGFDGLSKLSPNIRERIDALIWQASQGGSTQSSSDVVAAILHCVEERMGMHAA